MDSAKTERSSLLTNLASFLPNLGTSTITGISPAIFSKSNLLWILLSRRSLAYMIENGINSPNKMAAKYTILVLGETGMFEPYAVSTIFDFGEDDAKVI